MRIVVNQKKLKVSMYKMGFSNQDFAKEIGVTPVTLSRILNGKGKPSAKTAKKIIEKLDLEFDDVFQITN